MFLKIAKIVFYPLLFYPFAKIATVFCCFHYNVTRQCYDKIEVL